MRGIDKYISELLFDHDCVILPGVGGFLTNYSGARIHPIKHSFQPASRTVVFNANLRTNDGLLIDHLARRQNISYQQATILVNQYANQVNTSLESGQSIELSNIGIIKMGREQNIVFEPDESSNFLADAFGLPSFVSPAIKRETVRQRLEKQLTPKPSSPKEENKINFRTAANWAAGLAIPITAALLLYMFNPTIIDGPGKSFATFVPIITLEEAEPATNIESPAEFSKFRVVPREVADPDIQQPATSNNQPAPAPVLTKYQIVVGAFSQVSNAEKYVLELRAKNYDASIVGKNRTGLSRVSINGSENKNEAIVILNKIRASENPSAWLLRIR